MPSSSSTEPFGNERATQAPVREAALARLTSLPGLGPALSVSLEKLGRVHVRDLWFHLPLRYVDRTRITPISDVQIGVRALVEGRIDGIEKGFRFCPQLRVAISDRSQDTLVLGFSIPMRDNWHS